VVGWLWFLGLLVPVIGLVQVGGQSMADRYSYLPLTGVFIMVVWGVADATAGWTRRAYVLGPVAGVILAGCTALTWRQLGFWKNSETLFRHALAVTENNITAHCCLADVLALSPGSMAEALVECQEAVRIAPNSTGVHNALGKILAETPGRLAEGLAEFRVAVRLDPENADAHMNLGTALATTSEGAAAAIAEYETAVRLRPESIETHYNLALALARQPDRLREAISEFRATLQIYPDYAECHNRLGTALAQLPGHLPEAMAEFQATLRLKPDDSGAHYNLAEAFAQLPGRRPDAVAEYRTVLRLRPDWVGVRCNLGLVLAENARQVCPRPSRSMKRAVPGPARVRGGPQQPRQPRWSEFRAAPPTRSPNIGPRSRPGPIIGRPSSISGLSWQTLQTPLPKQSFISKIALRLKPDLEPARSLIAPAAKLAADGAPPALTPNHCRRS